ncbi:shikimate dehydrogenase [Flavobacterium branchiophilum]|uniref:Shikimate dehydrogenase n=2 Tax=Flavobacterium branchiophilum TaxID=55197 RepID=G2Z2W9_FLABF|nr:shikimate dehydrogenase [Flavobacterium branchiophilum]OXA82415.1 shikimate dehydrogenase [Flavobacterium branchiophilum] [Flavobacterium branchiophilum NBRC 15030 = ATCC 35035]PDS23749.1 shikimate dehydrogenase [Flavobacterium branchiophilum]TQM39568.1 shikimate dehydrogenase [Flavobacterium branchiophilum]CCB70298.1 Shikimate dehydrogenase [Flavobacterium branchiophilum FL-15]GEM56064.1 shikimate 5-dehydrogenase [Flavobacterium branchiophilum NBRC 15030 = ATCC 35035]
MKKIYGLVGKNISYSFSKGYFTEKFKDSLFEGCEYQNFDLQEISEFLNVVKDTQIKGLNVTIPYKQSVIPYLHQMSKKAQQIGAVNVIKINKKGNLKGYNSDSYGFKKSLKPLLQPHHKKALILGTGGASKAVAFALNELGIIATFVSREYKENAIDYQRLNETTFDNYQIVINCTPLGTSPNVAQCPDIPYQFFTEKHIAYDLIYNPEETLFLKKAKEHGAVTKNGLEMLIRQAEKAWKIWNK